MCKCTPSIKTPFCGKLNCEWPDNYRSIKPAFNVAHEQTRPSVLFRPTLTIDGDTWIALYGEDLQSGVAGCGKSPDAAMLDFDKAWIKTITPIDPA